MRTLSTLSLALLAILLAQVASAGDSPRFRGLNGDGKFDESGLLTSWPENGPALAWSARGLGAGYGSASVAGGTVFVPGMTPDEMGHVFLLTLDGKAIGDIPYGKETLNEQAPGSRCTPTIDENRLYMLSGLGVVYCISLDTKSTLWEVNLLERFQAENNTWNYAESLLIDGAHVICTPGGKQGLVAALDKMTGETVWATQGLVDQASYCSPTIATHNGHRILLTETAKFVVGINPDTGALLWSHGHETDYDIHAVTPIYDKGLVYYTGGYGSGGGALELSEDGSAVTLKWTDKVLDCQHHGVVLVDGSLYGTSQKGELICLEMATGTIAWKTREVRQGVTIFADGMLYVYEGPKRGVVSLVKAAPQGFELAGQFTVTEGDGNHWAHPIIVNGMLLIRHGDVLLAYNLKA